MLVTVLPSLLIVLEVLRPCFTAPSSVANTPYGVPNCWV
jgi:hypothetical protein